MADPTDPTALVPARPELSRLAVALQAEDLEALYQGWLELRTERAAAAKARNEERARLETKAQYLLNAVAAARDLEAPAPAQGKKAAKPKKAAKAKARKGKKSKALAPADDDPLAAFHAKAQAEVSQALAALAARERKEEGEFSRVDRQVRDALHARAERHLAIHRPRVTMRVHPVGKERVIVEVDRPGDEDAALLMRLLFGKLPSRWGFFSDDAVEDFQRGPALLYADFEVAEVFPADDEALDLDLERDPEFAPARLHIPARLPRLAFPRFRLVHHGPVAQVEARRQGGRYEQVFPREDAEALTGFLLRLKLSGRLELDLDVG